MTGRVDALCRAVVVLEAIVSDSPVLGGRQPDFYSVLGLALLRDAEFTGHADMARKAVAARRKALVLTSKESPAYPGRLSDLGAVLAVEYRITGAVPALQEAVRVHEAAARRADPQDPDRLGRLSNFGTALDELAMRVGDTTMLERAVTVQRDAIAAAAPGNPLLPMIISNLANALEHTYEETGSRGDLEEAIGLHRQAIAKTPQEDIEYYPRQTNLAVALQTRYELAGALADLDEGIDIFRSAVENTPADRAYRFKYLHGLASALMRLAERTGDLSGVDQAIRLWQDVVDNTPDGQPVKPGRMSALATAQFLRFRRDQSDLTPLEEAIATLRAAVALVPKGHAQLAMLMSNLGALLQAQFDSTGDRAKLEEAVSLFRRAAADVPADHSDRRRYLSNLGTTLVQQARLSDDPGAADQAITVLGHALEETELDDPGRAQTLLALGNAYARAFELGDTAKLSLGLTTFDEAAATETASLTVRMSAGRDGGRLAASAHAFDQALAAFGSAVRLMEESAWAGLGRIDQQRLLAELNGLPMDAAAIAIETGRPGEAVELLEQGRGVLLARQLGTHSLLEQLRASDPDLADQFIWVQDALDQTELDSTGLLDSDSPGPPARDLPSRRNRLARRRMAILDQIRSRPDLRSLMTPRLAEFLTAAVRGPVVIVNVSEYRCDALIITQDQVHLVHLSALTKQAVAEQAQKLLDAADTVKRTEVDDVLRWAWSHIAEPVFAVLGITEEAPLGQETHVWWCATGLAALLPLHAAGDYRDDIGARRTALDLAVSSYTPTLRTLMQLRQRPPAQAHRHFGPLIVAMPETPGLSDLEGIRSEVADLAGRFPVHMLLTGNSATRDAVAEAMPQHCWAHYACHASQDVLKPDRGALHLHDGPLTISQIVKLHLPDPAFAYISACDTSRGSTTIPDESITLAAALQVAGYQHVIATLWQISGLTATDIARYLYDQIAIERNGVLHIDPDLAAMALRTAVRRFRFESPEVPAMYWAPYIHTGP